MEQQPDIASLEQTTAQLAADTAQLARRMKQLENLAAAAVARAGAALQNGE